MSTQLEGLRRHVSPRAPAPPTGEHGHVVLVGSGKGGVGTSTVAALLALVSAARGARVLLVDGDDQVGSQHLLLGVHPRAGMAALRGGGVEPRDLLVPLSDRLALLPGGAGEGAPPSPAERRAHFRRVSSLYAEWELVVVDGGSRLDPLLAACGAGAGRLLAVSTPERIALTATYALVKALHGRAPALPVEVLVNGAEEERGAWAFEQLRSGAERFLAHAVGWGGALPDDPTLRAGVGAGMPVQDAAGDSPLLPVIEEVAERLIGTEFQRRS